MTVQSAQSVTILFSTRVFATGVGTIADSLPTGTLYLNGTANGATVTVTNISGGLYKAAVTMPTLAIGDEVELAITATVSTITDTAIVWGDTKDMAVDATGNLSITSNRKKASAATFEFLMTDSTTGAPKTGLTVAGKISKDGGAAANTSNSVTEIGLGQYQIVLTGTEMTANNIFLQFTSTGAVTSNLAIKTQP
jgi:hypothetical protein